MQHDNVLKKLNFDLLIPFPGLWWGHGVGVCGQKGVCGQNICYHFADLMIHFNIFCNMKLNLDLLIPSPRAVGEGVGLRAKYLLTSF